MKSILRFVKVIAIGACLVATVRAQGPTPAAAPVPPRPPQAPLAPAYQPPPAGAMLPFDFELAQQDALDAQRRAREDMARAQENVVRAQAAIARGRAGYAGEAEGEERAANIYRQGTRALDDRQYENAVGDFSRAADMKYSRADGALYWKAYALNKLGRRDEALATLAEIPKQYPQSRWLGDAKALEVEVRAEQGQGVSPESQTDEDLKLYAINSLINTDPDRTIPLLSKLLNDSKASPRLKDRALFVLAQTSAPKAREIVAQYAKGGTNPDLQLRAIEYVGTFNTKEGRDLLAEVYSSTNDPAVKRAVLRSYVTARDIDHLAAVAKGETDASLRREAIRDLAQMRRENSVSALASLYPSEQDKSNKLEIIRLLHNQNAVPQIIEIARNEKDPELKMEAVRQLSNMKSKEATDFMIDILSK